MVSDVEHEKHKELSKAAKAVKNMKKRVLKAKKQKDDALDKVTEQRQEIYYLSIELEEEKGKNQKHSNKFGISVFTSFPTIPFSNYFLYYTHPEPYHIQQK